MFRHMLVRLEDSPETEFAVGAALAFAKGYGGTVTGLYVREPAPIHVAPDAIGRSAATLSASGVPVSTEDADAHAANAGERQARTLSAFEDMCRKAGVPFRCDVRTGHTRGEFADSAGTADVVTMPRGEQDRGAIGSEVETLVKTVPHPFLIASEQITQVKRIAVAFDGSVGAVRALAAAADIARNWKPEQPEILLVEVVPRGAERAGHLAAAEAYLDMYELRHRSTVVHGTPGVELPEFAQREEVDLLCMGAYGHSTLREFFLGSTTQAVIENRRKPILLCH